MTPEQQQEILGRERRTMFVAMARAMRALLVVRPDGCEAALLANLNSRYWNVG